MRNIHLPFCCLILFCSDALPSAGKRFIDRSKLLSAAGFRPLRQINLNQSESDTAVFNLEFLLHDIMESAIEFDWKTFEKNELLQPIKLIASSFQRIKPIVLSREGCNFNDFPSLLGCIKASMAVPGVSGEMICIDLKTNKTKEFVGKQESVKYEKLLNSKRLFNLRSKVFENISWRINKGVLKSAHNINATLIASIADISGTEPIGDALLCEPIPYRSASAEGATHILVLRTRPDPCPVLGKGPGIYERFIARNFFIKYNQFNALHWILNIQHHRIYAEDGNLHDSTM